MVCVDMKQVKWNQFWRINEQESLKKGNTD